MGLTKGQWVDAIEDIKIKVYSGVSPTRQVTETPAEGKLPDMLFAKMEHCIGLDNKRPYMRHGMYFYKPYRNHYDAGPGDEPMWEALVEKRFAWKEKMYHLSLRGIYLLGRQTGIYIYNPNGGEQLLREVKDYFIYRGVDCSYDCWRPVTKSDVEGACILIREEADWAIKRLVKEGWIDRYKDAGITDEGFPYCRMGFRASKKLEETEEFKKAWKENCAALDAIVRGEN